MGRQNREVDLWRKEKMGKGAGYRGGRSEDAYDDNSQGNLTEGN